MAGKFVIPQGDQPEVRDWGELGWLSHPPSTGARQLTVIDVPWSGQGARFPQAPRPGGGDPGGRRQGRAVGRPGEAHPRPRRRAYVPADVVHASFNAGDGEAQDGRDPRALRRDGGYELVDIAGEAPVEDAAEDTVRTRAISL